ncbi:3-hydroxyacyl-CoA dehydrogenase NAD-binding domain-containing protein [Elizabethkingia anophelis]|uniref:3-hydroxyacyl-CoA dehydrogenase NAD-binding domain-containing protein n=1 Tax=Elizabethkingia anophelis TaxID=1117645 RepID=UPI00084004A0|nr:3-hydroxyacyl-CoA dehydrogenase NAD-binding domain-containing protein [Elizabethkingia anophelis]MCT3663764.1 3-hydroxybutyryl-CoA dehydrogenase [Elizabethkingia anophelis]MCT3763588.1 3-hydroxybutyryl-CoA dehydrogenase [Elizabethkingia anophelis]MCT3802734.1 3-hydroxybutyryl-CoA dehydrogenase [Elizabethkingia anophelis]MCT4059647.1 3-hydroxybutyryl-CoA dehydrogenase [Elizabethkingia anophelis]MCT4070256.1 3-hydroxybutyryl-CoA dehydrogenase [Elizabethkingia anophelis]
MNIGVIGSGTMGIGIAQVASANGCNVFLFDANSSQTEKALQNLKQTLTKLAEKQKISVEESEQIFSRVKFCTTLQELKDSDLVIEAIIENKEIKTKVFSELEDYVSDICIIGSNTSSISITSLSSELKRPERFIGIHFFNPAPLMPLVEIIPGLLTNEQLPQKVYDLMKSWKKVPVIAKDIPGFIVNRIARPYYGEALRIVEENIATPQQVDDAMTSLGNFRMGPFELMDLIGIDVNFAVTTTVYKDYFYDPKYKPSLLQQRMAEAKLLGRKTNRGFYDYREGAVKSVIHKDDALYEKIFIRIISMLVNEAVEAKRLSIANDEDIELAMQKGVNYPKGLLNWGKEIGYKTISETLQNLYNEYQEERYRQSPLLDKI